MEKEVIGYCPVCSDKLIATKLTCKNCTLDLTGDFSLNRFSYLSKDEQEFVALFLLNEGSYKEVQGNLNITYQKAKQTLADILVKLQLIKESEGEKGMSSLNSKPVRIEVDDSEHFVVKLIKTKLNSHGGKATIPLISAGKEAIIWFDKDELGLECDKIPVPNQLTWDVFVAAYNIAAAQDGEVYKGYARAGKLGSDKLPINSLEGYIAHAVHGVQEGGSAFSPGFIIAAILDWVGILVNERGSTVKLISEMVCVSSYNEAMQNAKTFIKNLDDSIVIIDRLNYFRHWYYFDELDGFAPSKFIGYKDMDIKAYEMGFNKGLDGKATEKALRNIFQQVEGIQKNELFLKLETFLNKYGKQPNAMSCIHVK